MRAPRLLSALAWATLGGAGGVVALPAGVAVAEGAQQYDVMLTDERAEWAFQDPCTGEQLHGVGIENGSYRITVLAGDSHHFRVRVTGVADLFDSADHLVGTWTYHLVQTDQVPPDGQGAVHLAASGTMTYATGRTAVFHFFQSHIFDKGDIEKFPERTTAACGGSRT